jgi:hypothetical protein
MPHMGLNPGDSPEGVLRSLLELQAETGANDFKRSYDGSKKARGELLKCIMAFANSPDGGFLVFGVAETATGAYEVTGLKPGEIKDLDQTKVADALAKHCSVVPAFVVHRVPTEGKTVVMIAVNEIGVGPVVCENELTDDKNRLVLRRGAIYTRSQSAKCDEMVSAADVTDIVQRAAKKHADSLVASIVDLTGLRRPPHSTSPTEAAPPSTGEPFRAEIQEAKDFFEAQGINGPGWYLEARPLRYVALRFDTAKRLRAARDESVVRLRGWDFPHVDSHGDQQFDRGVQSVTAWTSYIEAHRFYYSGLFAWRRRFFEDLPGPDGSSHPNGISFISTMWSLVEYLLFAARYLHDTVPTENAIVTLRADGLQGRYVYSEQPSVGLGGRPTTSVTAFERSVEATGLELENAWQDVAVDWTEHFFGMFELELSRAVISDWHQRLLDRRF